MKSFLQRLLHAGITPELTLQQTRTINFLNTITLLVVFLISMNTLYLLTQTPYTFSVKLLIAVSVSHGLLIAIIIPLNLRRKYLFARIYFGFVAGSFMCIYALLMGSETRWTFFSPIIIFIQFYIFPAAERKWMYAVITYCALSFIGCEFWFINHGAWLSFAPDIIKSFRYLNTAGFLFCAVALGMVGYNTISRTEKKLAEEHLRSENLLLNILPASIADRLKKTRGIIAEGYENVTILFADIEGFTPFSQKISPAELVNILNDIFSRFDALVEKYRLEKIKTIGDAYMVASGVPVSRSDHAEVLANFALDMQSDFMKYNAEHGLNLRLRIGISSGAVVAGVIGKLRFIYDLWGDCVNTASRMESHGIPGKIQVTATTHDLLKDKFSFEDRKEIEIKGKGKMRTFLLVGKEL